MRRENKMNYELLGQRIRKYRRQKKYTLEQLAERLDVSTTFIGQIERATGKPSLETLVKIANALEVSTDELLFDGLGEKAAESHFLKKVQELTAAFTQREKNIVLRNIELMREMKGNG